ncbi:unnamed protein product [Blepharisma stoltei]|uniref:Uncharacterized protein n=1 Tax=Blepharisma stoltei TaxID=1481888 RepID=A0AAU9K9V1_9CILI|nr:unnamed protein product [Blepharisma stoltei]
MARKSFRNLSINDSCYYQDSFLGFIDKSYENLFLVDTGSIYSTSFQGLFVWLIFVNIFLYECSEGINTYIILGFTTLSLLLYFMKLDRYMATSIFGDILCTVFQLKTIETGSLIECVGAFFPSFLLNILGIRKWMVFFIFSLLKLWIFYFTNNTQPSVMFFIIISYTILNYFIEKEIRDFWVLFHSYKKGFEQHDDIFMYTPNGLYIVDEERHILYHNIRAAEVAFFIGKADISRLEKFEDMFDDDHRTHVKRMVLETIKWEKRTEEVIIRKKDKENNSIVTLQFNFDCIDFKGKKCTKVVCANISNAALQDTFISNCYKDSLGSIEKFSKHLFQAFKLNEKVHKELLTKIYEIQHRLRTFYLIQCKLLSKIEIKKDYFDIQREIFNTIEGIFLKAAKRDLVITLNLSQNIPDCLIGDRTLHNYLVYSALDFIIKKSKKKSKISLSASIDSLKKSEIIVKYEICFASSSITQDELDCLFQIRQQASRRKTFNDLILIQQNYGSELLMFDSLVCLLRGYIDAKVTEKICIITINLPVIPVERKSTSKLELITGFCTQESDNEFRWKFEKKEIDEVIKEAPEEVSPLQNEVKEWKILLLCSQKDREKSIKNALKKGITEDLASVNSAELGAYLYEKEAKKGENFNIVFIDFKVPKWENILKIKEIENANEYQKSLFYGITDREEFEEDDFISQFDGIGNFNVVKFPIDIGIIKNDLGINDNQMI